LVTLRYIFAFSVRPSGRDRYSQFLVSTAGAEPLFYGPLSLRKRVSVPRSWKWSSYSNRAIPILDISGTYDSTRRTFGIRTTSSFSISTSSGANHLIQLIKDACGPLKPKPKRLCTKANIHEYEAKCQRHPPDLHALGYCVVLKLNVEEQA
jgi:hypothetical protein